MRKLTHVHSALLHILSASKSKKNAQAQEIAYTQLHLTQDSLLCRLCQDDIRKLLINPVNVPRWEKVENKAKCCINTCTNMAFVRSKVVTCEQVAHIIYFTAQLRMCHIPRHCVNIITIIILYNTLQSQQMHCYMYTCGTHYEVVKDVFAQMQKDLAILS